MKGLIKSEFRKVTSTRTVYLLALGAIGLTFAAVLTLPALNDFEASRPLREQQFAFLSTFVRLLLVVLGIRIVTDEYRFGTIVPTFSFSPKRMKVLAAKVVVATVVGALIAAMCQALLIGLAELRWSLEGYEFVPGDGAIWTIVGGVVAGTLWAVIGVGVGAVVRNQVIAIVGAFVWLMAFDEMLRGPLDGAARFLPGQAGIITALGGHEGAGFAAGVATMAVYAGLGLALGAVAMRRDAT